MLWRSLTALIVLFWAVMTGLIIRDAYFPDSSRFAVVPPKFVFDLFLSEAAAFNNMLHLYHEDERIGHASLVIRKQDDSGAPMIYALAASGAVSLPQAESRAQETAFRLTAELENGERWTSFNFDTHSPASKLRAQIAWKLGSEMPEIEVRRDEEVLMNTEIARNMMALQGGGSGGFGWLSQLGGPAGTGVSGTVNLRAREGTMDLAGKQRKCYIVTATLLGMYEVLVYFTEVGELARIELPQGYRLIEPMMHGLEPDVKMEE